MKKLAVLPLLFALALTAAPGDAPSALDLLVRKAHALEARDRVDLAAQVWQQILITNPDQRDALAGLARWARRSGRVEEANAYLGRLRKIDPDAAVLAGSASTAPVAKSQDPRINRAFTLAADRQYAEAWKVFREVYGSNPPAGPIGALYYETEAQTAGGLEPAIAALRKLAHDHPEMPDYQLTAGRLLTYHPVTRAEGVAVLAAISPASPAGAKAQSDLRQALLWEKQNPAFLPAIRSYLARTPDPELEAAAAGLTSRPAAPSASAESGYSREETLGYAALKSSKFEQAEAHFNAALQSNPRSAPARTGLGFVRMKQQDFAAAIEQFEAARQEHPKSAEIAQALETARFWLNIQSAAQATSAGNSEDAVQRYRAALAARPASPEALAGLAGVLLRMNRPAEAAQHLEHLVRVHPHDPDAWQQLIAARLQAQGPAAAFQTIHSLPPDMRQQLNGRPAFQLLEASARQQNGENSEAARILSRFDLTATSDLDPGVQAQLATLLLATHRAPEAEEILRRLVVRDPDNNDTQEAWIAALVASGRNQGAENAWLQMPSPARSRALEHPGVLQSLAAAEAALGKPSEAETLLERVLDMPDSRADARTKLAARLQLAPVLASNGQTEKAEQLVTGIVEGHPENEAAWKAYLLLLGAQHRGREILAVLNRMPADLALRFQTEPDTAGVLATAHAAAGDPETGLQILESAITRLQREGSAIPPSLDVQLCWLLLDMPGKQRELFHTLEQLRSRGAMPEAQRNEVSTIWVTWILRTAEQASRTGDAARALAILKQGLTLFPANARLQGAYAGDLLKAGDTKSALAQYANWGLTGASVDDYAGAVGSALSQRNYLYADTWLAKALTQWPADPQLLTLAGDRSQSKGDLKTAERYWREALARKQAVVPPNRALLPDTQNGSASDPAQALGSLLLGADTGEPNDPPSATTALAGTPPFSPVHLARADADSVQPALLPAVEIKRLDAPGGALTLPVSLAGSGKGLVTGTAPPAAADSGPSLEDRLASIDTRNTPFIDSGVNLQSRSGQAGLDRLLIEQANFEASTVLSNQVRVSLIAKPTYLSSGSANGTGTTGFGSSGTPVSLPSQTASGIAGEVQLSTQTFGIHAGSSPFGFPVHNVIGGIRFQPGNGHFTFILDRDDVRDTMLSFAGLRDPDSKQTWGGVVSNTASVLGHWGDDRSGIYASLSYQGLSGKEVASNRAVNGNFGTYWKLLTNKQGSLTLGLNFDAMHYDKNLRYFTLGQGGYFSPQQYFLSSVPFRWTGTYAKRLQYILGGALGVQHFEEDESPFFPLNPALQSGKTGGYYPSLASTGANFSLDARLTYQLAPNWFLGAWASANNSRNYTASSGGVFVKYTFEPRPLGLDNSVPSVPDWKGQQPFRLF